MGVTDKVTTSGPVIEPVPCVAVGDEMTARSQMESLGRSVQNNQNKKGAKICSCGRETSCFQRRCNHPLSPCE